jgi:hypothetical protein
MTKPEDDTAAAHIAAEPKKRQYRIVTQIHRKVIAIPSDISRRKSSVRSVLVAAPKLAEEEKTTRD